MSTWTPAKDWHPKYHSSKLTALIVLRTVRKGKPNYGWWTSDRVAENCYIGKRTAERCLSYWVIRGYLEYRRGLGYRAIANGRMFY